MNKSRRSPHTFVFAITMLVAFSSSSPAQVIVLISGGFSAPIKNFCPNSRRALASQSPRRGDRLRAADPMDPSRSALN
jgi:hypothetical protein